MTELTLIGTRLAEAGREFVYHGEASACAGCPYREQCLNLVEGRRYRVTERREGAPTLECGVHDDGVVAVRVEPAPVPANVPAARAFSGSLVELAGPCPHTGCPSHEFCEPPGAAFGDEHRITAVRGEPPHDYCHLDRELTHVELAPEPSG